MWKKCFDTHKRKTPSLLQVRTAMKRLWKGLWMGQMDLRGENRPWRQEAWCPCVKVAQLGKHFLRAWKMFSYLNLGVYLTCREGDKLRPCPCSEGEQRTGKHHWDPGTSILLWLAQSLLFESRLQPIAWCFSPQFPGEWDTGSLMNAYMYWYDLFAFHSCLSLQHYY